MVPLSKLSGRSLSDPSLTLLAKLAADREDCPHCGAMMERGDDGTCNRCGKDWPEKTSKDNRPYRDRVEIYGLTPRRELISGIWDSDRVTGVPGGGVDEGETPEQAAVREFREETGYGLRDVRPIDTDPVVYEWYPPYSTPEQAARAAKFRGSRTLFYTGAVDSDDYTKPNDPVGLTDIRPRALDEAIELATRDDLSESAMARGLLRRSIMMKLRELSEKTSIVKDDDARWEARLDALRRRRDPDGISTQPVDVAFRKAANDKNNAMLADHREFIKRAGLRSRLMSIIHHISSAPGAPSQGFKYIDPVAEETKELFNQNLLRRLTFGLSDKPNFHIQDRVIGGVAGGGISGYADEKLRDHTGSTGDWAGRAAAILGGGFLGGKGLNASMNVGRRYIAETSPLFGYSVPRNNKTFRDKLRDLWRFGIKGEQRTDYIKTFDDAVNKAVLQGKTISGDNAVRLRQNREMARARHELLRRYLGIHSDDAAKDIFRRVDDGTYRYNTKVMRPGNDTYEALVAEPTRHIGMENALNPNRYSHDPSKNMYAAVFGSHDMRLDRGLYPRNGGSAADYTVSDVWNFAIDPHETDLKRYALGLAKSSPLRWKEYLSRPVSAATHPSMVDTGTETVGSRLASGSLRSVMEKVFRHHSPVIRQPMTMQFAPEQHMAKVRYPRPLVLPSDKGQRKHIEKVFDIILED